MSGRAQCAVITTNKAGEDMSPSHTKHERSPTNPQWFHFLAGGFCVPDSCLWVCKCAGGYFCVTYTLYMQRATTLIDVRSPVDCEHTVAPILVVTKLEGP